MTSRGNSVGHIAVCPFPFSSHPLTLLLLSRKIASSSVHVSFLTTSSSSISLSASLPSEKDDTVKIRIIDDGLEGDESIKPPESMRRFMEASEKGLRRGMMEAEDEIGVKITCVVADAFLSYVCRDIAQEKGVKWVALWTSATAALLAHMYTDHLRTQIRDLGGVEACQDHTVERYIPKFPAVGIKYLAKDVLGDLSSSPIGQMLHKMSHILPKAACVAINSFDTLESDTTESLNSVFGNIFVCAGPFSSTLSPPTLHSKDPEGCLTWLDTHKLTPRCVVYISFGTAHTPPPHEFAALAEALEARGIPFLWSLPERFRASLPDGFVDRTRRTGKGKVVGWAPQTSVLGHVAVGAQLTHCGWNSVMESVVSGVPMICRALPIAEQRFNERLVVGVWGIGVEVEGGKITKTAVTRAVERVLQEEEGRKIRERIQEMRRLIEEATADPQGTSVHNLNKFISIIIDS